MEYTESEIAKIKAEAKEYKGLIDNLKGLIYWIKDCKEANENYYYEFEDKIYYTLLDDEESCYKRVTGISRDEFIKQEEEYKEKLHNKMAKIKKQMALNNMPQWIEDGNKLIYPQKQKDWKDLIELRIEGEPYGKDVAIAIQVMKSLESDGDFQTAYDIIKERNLSGSEYSSVLSLVVNFYKKGTAFYRFIDKAPTDATIKFIEKIENRNKEYNKELGI